MRFSLRFMLITICLIALGGVTVQADEFLESLKPDQIVHGFKTINLYDNNSGQAMGARFISEKNGFIIDLLQIQSVPQAFYWIKTPVTASRGEPHACEHLLLGKGNRGRYVAALEDMALGNSTAYTAQYHTCYHFNTSAGEETFYEIFEAKLQALLHPDFTDEEIRREVCNVGVIVDVQDSTLSIDEKGTCYTEMVSSFERPWYHTYGALNKLVYGEDHPLTNNSGGDPDVMRSMVPQDMWDFHAATHHLANMGSIVSLPTNVPVESFLKQMSETLDRCQEAPDSSSLVGIGAFDFPPPNPAPPGTRQLVNYPSDRTEDPGSLMYSWPADLELGYKELSVLELFLETFAGGETSDLYDIFINSETQAIDIGASGVSGWIEDDLGHPICFDLTGINSSLVSEAMLDSVSGMIIGQMQKIYDFADGSEELALFNKRARNRMIETRKQVINNLNQPPMFGFRSGPAGAWLSIMNDLEKEPGFRKSLVFEDHFTYLDSLLKLDNNIWKERLDAWRLLTVPPYAVGATPSPDIIAANAAAKEARLTAYVEGFKTKYDTDDAQLAIARYKEEFDAKTAELDAITAGDIIPGFIDNPPMTLDDQLDYEILTLEGNVPFVASTFDNMSSSRVGLALGLDVIPEAMMTYVPFLPSLMTDIGVVKAGDTVTFDEMTERLRLEVLDFSAYFSTGMEVGRIELVLAGEGGNIEELHNALGWMDAALFTPYLSADNLPRIQDRLDQMIQKHRRRIQWPEEYWVRAPSNAYRFQDNPLFMATNCFFTQIPLLQNLRWLLTDPGDEATQAELATFMEALEATGTGQNRDALARTLSELEAPGSDAEATDLSELAIKYNALGDSASPIIKDVVLSLRAVLADIPDANLTSDWTYLCNITKKSLLTNPEVALTDLGNILEMIASTDNARAFMISNRADREASLAPIGKIIGKLSSDASTSAVYEDRSRVIERLASREPDLDQNSSPTYVGLVHEGTQNGVLMFSAAIANQYDTTYDAMINCLSGKLYSGGGPHGLFMKTWAAGLAYSNGYGYRHNTGRVSYYAERCPDVTETMKFVVNELKTAEANPGLTDYAIAQIFGASRAASRYEQRGEAMAANLTDGTTPETVRTFRERVLALKGDTELYEKIRSRMPDAYGPVLIGYGKPLAESKDGSFFLIGPEPQFESLEKYIETVESKQPVYRLYPRDFWLTL